MSTYRTGNHQPKNLYRDDQYIGVMFDPADAALIVDVMEGRADTPDVDHTNGAREALAEVRRRLDAWHKLNPLHDGRPAVATVMGMLRDAAAELGVGEDAPPGRPSTPQSAQNGPGVGQGANGSPEGSASAHPACDCGHEGLDAMFHRQPCPVAKLRTAARRLGYDLALIPREDTPHAEPHCETCGGPCRDETDQEEA